MSGHIAIIAIAGIALAVAAAHVAIKSVIFDAILDDIIRHFRGEAPAAALIFRVAVDNFLERELHELVVVHGVGAFDDADGGGGVAGFALLLVLDVVEVLPERDGPLVGTLLEPARGVEEGLEFGVVVVGIWGYGRGYIWGF